MSLKVLSWNIWFDGDLNVVNKFLESSQADIIGLQEVIQIGTTVQLSQHLTHELNYHLVYAPVFQIQKNNKTVTVGNAILTKYPILSSNIHNLSKIDNRVALEAKIKVKDITIQVISTHLIHTHQQPSEIQDIQAENLLKILSKINVLLMGDFNALPESNAVRKISSILKNADIQLLPTWSVYPEGCKECLPQGILYKLDNIFTSNNLLTDSYKVEISRASDHLPISVIVEM